MGVPLATGSQGNGFARELEDSLSSFEAGGHLKADFDPRVMAIAIRAAIDTYARQIADLFVQQRAPRPKT